MTATQGTPLDGLKLVASGVYICSPIVPYILAYFKLHCLTFRLPSNLNLGAD